MRKLLVFAFCAMVCLVASPTKADSTSQPDPVMRPANNGGCGSTMIMGSTFTFSGASSSVPTDCFVASVSSPSLAVGTTLAPSQIPTGGPCGDASGYTFTGSDLFTKVVCSFNSTTDQLTLTWSGTGQDCPTCNDFTGIVANQDFFMDFSGWSSGQMFNGTLATPEPGTMLSLALGLCVLLIFSRSKFATKTS